MRRADCLVWADLAVIRASSGITTPGEEYLAIETSFHDCPRKVLTRYTRGRCAEASSQARADSGVGRAAPAFKRFCQSVSTGNGGTTRYSDLMLQDPMIIASTRIWPCFGPVGKL
jgi:hypothetical protein